MKKKSPVRKAETDDDDSEDDMPLVKRAASKPVKKEESDSDTDDDTPLVGSEYTLRVRLRCRKQSRFSVTDHTNHTVSRAN